MFSYSKEVQEAINEKRPVVALESTIISHGLPYPQNIEIALDIEKTVIQNGATPATIAILGGKVKVGLSMHEIEELAAPASTVEKASMIDICLLYTSPSPRDATLSRMPSSA